MAQLTADLIRQIVKRHKPRGWRVRESKHRYNVVSGSAHWDKRTLYVPTLKDAISLFVFLHECGHVHMRHFHLTQPDHRQEYEAELYAVHVFRSEGIPLSRSLLALAKERVKRVVEIDERHGIKIQAHVRRWAQ
jgi:hypothetical protein